MTADAKHKLNGKLKIGGVALLTAMAGWGYASSTQDDHERRINGLEVNQTVILQKVTRIETLVEAFVEKHQ